MVGRRFGWVFLSLLALGVLEIIVFVLVAQAIGTAWTLLLLVATVVLGTWLLRREGVRAWRRFRAAAETGRPGREATDGLVGLSGAMLLALPGFISTAAGLFLLFPPVRAAARSGVQRLAEKRLTSNAAGDLFGPRRVRVRPGAPTTTPPGPPAQPPTTGPPAPVIEGEIVD